MGIPNILSIIRLLLIPVFSAVYLTAKAQPMFYISAAILLLSGITDILDGFIARKYHMVSELGKFLDPLADKLTQVTVCVCLAIRYKPFIALCVVFVLKELAMLIGGMILLKKNRSMTQAHWFGKMATVIIYIIMVAITAQETISNQTAIAAVCVIGACLLFSFCMYIPVYLKNSHK